MTKMNKRLFFLNVFNILEPIFFAVSLFSIYIIGCGPLLYLVFWLKLPIVLGLIPVILGLIAQLYWAFIWDDVMKFVKDELENDNTGN